MTTKIAKVSNLALHVFRTHSLRVANGGAVFPTVAAAASTCDDPEALKHLLANVAALTLHDVGLDSPFSLPPPNQLNAPVAYMHITENEVFSMGMFILRPGSRIPLHGHPGMFGVIRVMQGSMRCRSFTPLSHDESPTGASSPPSGSSKDCGGTAVMWRLAATSDLTVAEPHADRLLGASDRLPCLLTPCTGNLHELTAVEGTVVFIDILSPPYDHDLGTRECLFYREIDLPTSSELASQTQGSSRVYLTEINQPGDYWCELLPYHGPPIS
ncbi:2-aminoethanethiol dioxygenase [Echinococcus granulosus]|nr:2-aminoethanethiol dioxygenase [Echinococcus granulosus]CDS17909.1 2 aminoethanethiol dioxygenase [Echinococcus granulosus]